MHSGHLIRHTVVAAILVACVAGLAAASEAPATGSPALAIDQTVTNGTINPELFGVIMNWPTNAEGAYNPTNGVYHQQFLTLAQTMGIGSVRFVGGNESREAYEWERGIGPESSRTWNRVGDGHVGQPSTVGSDEIGQLIDDLGAKGVAITNIYRETAQYAADWVAYMTAPTTNTWGAMRAANGHSAPYPIDYFDVGNEQDLVPDGWTTGANPVVSSPHSASCNTLGSNAPDCLYAFGGTSSFTNQNVVKYANLDTSQSVGDGTANQVRYASYPPVKTGQTVKVGGTAWTPVSSLGAGGNIYTIDHTTGEIDFGNGTTGNEPPNGASITITYDSGPHDGFVDFYSAMKAVNSSISVCAEDTNQAFLDAMGTTYPYDCLAWHGALGDGFPSTGLGNQAFMQAELSAPDTQSTNEQNVQNRVDTAAGKHIPIVVTAYGHKHGNQPSDFPNEHLTLTDGLLEARQLQEWIDDGVPLAHRFMLNDEFFNPAGCPQDFDGTESKDPCVNGIIQSDGGTNYVGEPDGIAMGLMSQLGGRIVVGATPANIPTISTANGTISELTFTATKSGTGIVQLAVVNQDLTDSDPGVTVNVSFAGSYTHQTTAPVETLNGATAGTINDETNPTAVSITTANASVGSTSFNYTFPPHSVTLITLTKA